MFTKNIYFPHGKYKPDSQVSILNYAKKTIGKNLLEVCKEEEREPFVMQEIMDRDFKWIPGHQGNKAASFGSLYEEFYFGFQNPASEPDFSEASLELKTAGIQKDKDGYRTKEPRITLSAVSKKTIIDEEFETSNFIKKNKEILIMLFEDQENPSLYHPIHRKVLFVDIWKLEGKNHSIIKKDWEIIRDKVRKDEKLSLGDTKNLGTVVNGTRFDFKGEFLNEIIKKITT